MVQILSNDIRWADGNTVNGKTTVLDCQFSTSYKLYEVKQYKN